MSNQDKMKLASDLLKEQEFIITDSAREYASICKELGVQTIESLNVENRHYKKADLTPEQILQIEK